MSSVLIPAERKESLRDSLQATVDALQQRRASEIDESVIEDYITLNWMEWWGGSLRLTTTGQNIHRQIRLAAQPRN